MSDEEAKAAQEVAKTTGKALDKLGNLGGWFNDVFGSLVEDAVGVISDKLRFHRIEQALLLRDKVQKRLNQAGIKVTVPVPPRVGIPLIEEATLADSEELHTKWSNLLSNAMNPAFAGEITRNFVSILADLEPIDAKLLDAVMAEHKSLLARGQTEPQYDRDRVATMMKINVSDCEVSLRNLMRLGLVKPGLIVSQGVLIAGQAPTTYMDTKIFGVTLLGERFHSAVN